MTRNARSLVIGALVVATVVLGYQLYQEEHKTDDIGIGERGNLAEKR